MAFLKYTGLSHFRELLAEDLAKAGVEVKQALVFARHEVTEVTDEVAKAITQLVGDEFEKVRKDTKEAVRDLTVDDPVEPQVQGQPPMTDRPNPDSAPAGNQVANEPAPPVTPA